MYPLDNDIDLAAADASLQIFRGNEAMMNEADAVIANLTPFRGPGADAGTVYELGLHGGRAESFASDTPTIPASILSASRDSPN